MQQNDTFSQVDTLLKRLQEIISLENRESLETLGSYIVGELLGDYNGIYQGLYEKNPTIQKIGDLASDLEISNGTEEQLQDMWREVKELTRSLNSTKP